MRWPVPEKVKPPCTPAQGILTVSQDGGTRRRILAKVRKKMVDRKPYGGYKR